MNMDFAYSKVHSPKWANKAKTKIDCFVQFSHMKHEVCFTASPDDVMRHGKEIFAKCMAGEFGQVSDYSGPSDKPVITLGNQPIPSLNLAVWPEFFEFINEANLEVARGTIRGIIMVWSCMLELVLGRLIEAFLIDHKTSKDMIWENSNSSLATFSGRIDMAFCLGLLTKEQHTLCHAVRKIRNEVAHSWNFNFNNKKSIEAAKILYNSHHKDRYVFSEDPEFLAKLVYSPSCASLIMNIVGKMSDIRRCLPLEA